MSIELPDVQDIIVQYIESLINEGTDNNFHIGYYNMVAPNEFTFTERVGSKYLSTSYIPCMLEEWSGNWEPLPNVRYINLGVNLTVMVKLDNKKDSVFIDLNRLTGKLVGLYQKLIITNQETQEETECYLAFGSSIPRPIGGSILWGGRRYLRMILPITVMFSINAFPGNVVQNKLDGILLPPVYRPMTRENEPYPVQLLTYSGSASNALLTKRNRNKENAWTSDLSFVWNNETDFIIKYLASKDYDQNRTFTHELILNDITITREVNIISGGLDPEMGVSAIITITIMEAFTDG